MNKNNNKYNKKKGKTSYSTRTKEVYLSVKDVMFPDRLRARGRTAINQVITYNSSALANSYLLINNPISVVASQNMSGLAWLISGTQANGTSYAPYALGIVRRAKIEVYAKTVATPTGPTSALVTMFPLSPNQSSNTMSLTAVEESFGRSNIIEMPIAYDTVSRAKPLITKSYNIWDILGISEEVYMNDSLDYAFGYAGLLTAAPTVYLDVFSGTESATTDATLSIRLNIIVTLEMEFFSRNNNIFSAPHS